MKPSLITHIYGICKFWLLFMFCFVCFFFMSFCVCFANLTRHQTSWSHIGFNIQYQEIIINHQLIIINKTSNVFKLSMTFVISASLLHFVHALFNVILLGLALFKNQIDRLNRFGFYSHSWHMFDPLSFLLLHLSCFNT